MWFQNRRAKWRKNENTKKGPGRPAHNATPQTCSGAPIDPEEVKRREANKLEKQHKKQLERLSRLEEKRRRHIGDTGDSRDSASSRASDDSRDRCHGDGDSSDDFEIDVIGDDDVIGKKEEDCDRGEVVDTSAEKNCSPVNRSPFCIDNLLQKTKVPRGRRPNSKYPRVQASKSMNPLSLGMLPLFPITQPIGFKVEPLPSPSSSPSRTVPETDTSLTTHAHSPSHLVSREAVPSLEISASPETSARTNRDTLEQPLGGGTCDR